MNSAASLVPLSWLPQAAEEPPEEASGPLACGAEAFHSRTVPRGGRGAGLVLAAEVWLWVLCYQQ